MKYQNDNEKWDNRFLELADHIAQWSKDPSSKVGAVIVRPNKSIASVGFNGFPIGMNDSKSLYNHRDIKYSRIVHAEINALIFCRDTIPLSGYTLYTTGPCCDRCAILMIQAGIRRYVYRKPTLEQHQRWNIDKTISYFIEVDAEIIEID